MNIQHLVYVLEVNRWRSFSKAAESLYTSQSRLSQAIIELEKEVGFVIFERNSKGISAITTEGAEIIKRAKSIVGEFNEFKTYYSEHIAHFKLSSISNYQVEKIFENFIKEFKENPNFAVEINITHAFETIEDVSKRDYDLGIIAITESFKEEWLAFLDDQNIEFVPIEQMLSYFVVKEDYVEPTKGGVTFEDLKDCTYAHLYDYRNNKLNYFEFVMDLGAKIISKEIIVANRNMAYGLVAQGDTFFSESNFRIDEEYLKTYGVKGIRPIEELQSLYRLGYIKMKKKPLSLHAKRFIELLKIEANGHK